MIILIKGMYIFCLFVWGLNFIAIKIQGNPVSLELSLTYRLGFTTLLFFVLYLFKRSKNSLSLKDVPYLFIFGICNFALSYLLLYYATGLSSAAVVTLIFSLKVILTPISIRIFLGEKVERRTIIGGVFGVLGVLILIYPSLMTLQDRSDLFKGIVLALVGTIFTAIGDACSARNAGKGIDPILANVIGFMFGTLLLLSIVLYQGESFYLPKSGSYLAALSYLTLFASFFAWLFYLELVKSIGASKSGYMVALFPALGGLASLCIGESQPSFSFLTGCIFSCIGAAIALGLIKHSTIEKDKKGIKFQQMNSSKN